MRSEEEKNVFKEAENIGGKTCMFKTRNKNTDFTALVFSAPAGGGYLHLCHDIS